jgi:intergrase/recombinase
MTTIIPGLFGLDSATAFKLLQKDPQKYIDNFTKSNKQLQSDEDYFNKKVGSFKTVDDLLKDSRSLKYVMESYGLGTETGSIGLIKKVLTQDPTVSTSLVNQLADTRYKTMATDLRLDQGLGKLTKSTSVTTVEDQYVENKLEDGLGESVEQIKNTAKTESNYFSLASSKFTSTDDLFKDQRALKYVLDSYGLGSDITNTKLKDILTQDPTKTTSLINQAGNSRFVQIVKDLRLDQGTTNLKSDTFYDSSQQGYVKNAVKNSFITSLGTTAGNAKIASITATAQTEIDYFNKNVSTYKTTDLLLKDTRGTQFLLDAYGVKGIDATATTTLKKVFSQDPTVKGSLVSTLNNPELTTLSTDLRLDKGTTKLSRPEFLDTLQTNYVQNMFEEALGDQDDALRQAAYFARNSSTIKDVYSVLGDKVLRSVVTSTLNLPTELAIQPIESQAAAVAKRVDVTKFINTSSSSVTATQLSRAQSDHKLIENNLAVSDSAISQVTTIKNTLDQLATNYSLLPTITDPNGANADTIAIQQTAVPELVRYTQLAIAGDTALTSVNSSISSLKDLITQAGKSGADIDNLKTQFSTIVDSINDAINGASITNPDGTTENILLNGSADTLTTVYDAQGSSASINRYDLTGLQSLLSNANAAFGAVTDTTDSNNLNTALSNVLRGGDAATAADIQIVKDGTALDKAATSGFFAATLNTSDLLRGQQSINDGLSRVDQITDVLSKIGDIASKAAALADGADRTDLESQFADYKTQLHSLIENTGTAGLDNFLNNIPDQSYEIVNGKAITVKGNIDLQSQIVDAIDAASLSDSASATELQNSTIRSTTYTTRATVALNASKPILDNTIKNFDPRGKLDNQLYAIQTQIDPAITNAGGRVGNLLDPTQKNINLNGLSTGTSLTFHSVSTFQQDITDALTTAVGQLNSSNLNDLIFAVDDATNVAASALRTLSNDNRTATIEYGRLGSTIDALDSKNTSTSSTLYQTNTYTQKFITRYLATNGATSSSGGNSYLSALFDSTDSSTAISGLFSLINQLKA